MKKNIHHIERGYAVYKGRCQRFAIKKHWDDAFRNPASQFELTPPKFNMEPENNGFQKDFPFPGTCFQFPC